MQPISLSLLQLATRLVSRSASLSLRSCSLSLWLLTLAPLRFCSRNSLPYIPIGDCFFSTRDNVKVSVTSTPTHPFTVPSTTYSPAHITYPLPIHIHITPPSSPPLSALPLLLSLSSVHTHTSSRVLIQSDSSSNPNHHPPPSTPLRYLRLTTTVRQSARRRPAQSSSASLAFYPGR